MFEVLRRVDATLAALTLLLIGALCYAWLETPSAIASRGDAKDLKQQLAVERARAASLKAALQAEQRLRVGLEQQLFVARKRMRQLEAAAPGATRTREQGDLANPGKAAVTGFSTPAPASKTKAAPAGSAITPAAFTTGSVTPAPHRQPETGPRVFSRTNPVLSPAAPSQPSPVKAQPSPRPALQPARSTPQPAGRVLPPSTALKQARAKNAGTTGLVAAAPEMISPYAPRPRSSRANEPKPQHRDVGRPDSVPLPPRAPRGRVSGTLEPSAGIALLPPSARAFATDQTVRRAATGAPAATELPHRTERDRARRRAELLRRLRQQRASRRAGAHTRRSALRRTRRAARRRTVLRRSSRRRARVARYRPSYRLGRTGTSGGSWRPRRRKINGYSVGLYRALRRTRFFHGAGDSP